jgi:uncharacterized protein (DUF1330 family)
MAAYIIAQVEVKNPEAYQEYSRQVLGILTQYGGKFLVRGGKAEILEGDQAPHRLVVIEFEDAEQARRWYNSPEYQAIVGIRQANSIGNLFLVEGWNG